MSPPSRRTARRRLIALACLAAAGAGAGLGIASSAAAGATALRTADATIASISRTLDVSGVLQPADEATVAFQVAGTVAAVNVTQGEQVAAGQTLASLDPSDLQSQVTAAEAELTAAQAKLSSDESAQTATVPSGSATTTDPPAGETAATTGTANASAASPGSASKSSGTQLAGISGDQQAVVNLQRSADADLATAQADLAAAEAACSTGSGGTGAGGRTTTTTAPTTTTTTTAPTTTTTTTGAASPGPGTGSSNEACAAALGRAEADQLKIATVQKALAAAEDTLAQALATAERAQPAPTATSGSGAAHVSTQSTPAASTDTPAQLASDQAAIDSDEASLVEAQQSLGAATLTSPLAGTVASVGISAGQYVPAASTTASIVVVGSGGYQTTTDLTTAQVQGVKVGDAASLSIDGINGTFAGAVSDVGPVQVSSTGTYIYPVVIAITSALADVAVGSETQIQIALDRVAGVLAVPTSAVHTAAAGDSFVYVDRNGKEVEQKVRVGMVGPVYTQIESGISAGQAVVIADASLPVPASSTSALALRGLAGGAVGGRAFFGGRAGRAAPGG